MKIALGSDHRGTEMRDALADALERREHATVIFGPTAGESSDYPDSARDVGNAVADGGAEYGILICGSGIGMSMAANKVPGVRAALVIDEYAARMTRRHNDANVLCLSGDRTTIDHALSIIDAFLGSEFEGGRHARRVEKMDAIDREACCDVVEATERRRDGATKG